MTNINLYELNLKELVLEKTGLDFQSFGNNYEKAALAISQELRAAGFIVELDCSEGTFSKQFKRANRTGAKWALVIGDDEVRIGKAPLKYLQNSSPQKESLQNEQLHPLNNLESIMNTLRQRKSTLHK